MLVSTSRGCPFKCTFCTIPQTSGSTIRYRTPEAVVADIRQQMALSGHRYIYFADDNFTVNPTRTKSLLRKIIGSNLGMRFSAQVRVETTCDPELMDLLAKAGCYLVFVGFESLNESTLAEYRKGGRQTPERIETAVREFHKHRIMVHGMFVIGSDSDQPGTAMRTARWAEQLGLESLQMLPICPLPGTQLLTRLEEEGRVFKSWDEQLGGPYIPYGAGNYVLYNPRQMTPVELQKELLAAYTYFYRPRNLLRAAMKLLTQGMIRPAAFQFLGWRLSRQGSAEVREHILWLNRQAPSTVEGAA